MSGIRKLIQFTTGVMLAASLTPAAHAATKQFSISATQGAGTLWTLTYKNGSQGGGTNSNINSVTFVPPFHVSNVTVQPSLVTGNTVISPASCKTAAGCDAQTISVTWINGIPPSGGTGFITMNGSAANAPGTCSSGLQWSAQAFTGNALGGTNFSPLTATTNAAVSCVLQFVTQPANAQAGVNITSTTGPAVQVQALVGGAVATWFTGNTATITLSSNPDGGIAGASVSATSGVSSFGSGANPPQTALTLATPGTYTLTASAPAGSGFLPATSNAFKIFAGTLDCSEKFPLSIIDPADVAPDQPGYATGMRNGWNKDGITDGACVPVLYTFTNNILVTAGPLAGTVNLTWDTQSQVNAAFQYTVNWQPIPVDSTSPTMGWSTSPQLHVAWLDTNGNLVTNTTPSANIAWTPALACMSSSLPVPYGTLAADVGTNQGTVTINNVPNVTYPDQDGNTYLVPPGNTPNIPPVPFPIVIADNVGGVQSTTTERMTAVAIMGTPTQNGDLTWNITYQVTRGTATEGGSTIANHSAGYSVMSTPLPIIPNDSTTFKAPYQVNKQAQMCIAKHGFTSFQIDANGKTRVMYTSTIFDIGDGWVLGR